MFPHIIKLIWKKKKSNFLMMLEIFFSFLILFAVWSLTVYSYHNYIQPTGLSTDYVWAISLEFNTERDSMREIVANRLKEMPEIEAFSFTSPNMPFSFSTCNNGYDHNGVTAMSELMNVEPSYPAVMGLELIAGRWFTKEDTIGNQKPMVITRHLAETLFGSENPIGQTTGTGDEQEKVVGVVSYFRHKSSFQADGNCAFEFIEPMYSSLLVKLKPSADAEFEARLVRALHQLDKNWTIDVGHLDQMRDNQNQTIWIPILILFIVCGFLVFNVSLGMFGVLFQNINRRKGEIGLRRAIGATQKQILTYFISETLVIAGFGIVLGVFFAIQIPLLNVFDLETSVYGWGIVLAILSVLVITALCAFYPSKQAAAIYPAVALHEE
jgi:putative ABC transport system permease protein